MSNDDHDDGLVHHHNWASAPQPEPGPMLPRQEIAHAMAQHPEEEERYDDGLVHSHGWACGERSRLGHMR